MASRVLHFKIRRPKKGDVARLFPRVHTFPTGSKLLQRRVVLETLVITLFCLKSQHYLRLTFNLKKGMARKLLFFTASSSKTQSSIILILPHLTNGCNNLHFVGFLFSCWQQLHLKMHKFSANSFVFTILAASLIFCIPTTTTVFESDECQAEKAAIICLLLCANTFPAPEVYKQTLFCFLCFLPPVKNHANWRVDIKFTLILELLSFPWVCYGIFASFL